MKQQTFQGFNATALRSFGAEIKSLAKYSTQSDQELSRTYHVGTHTIQNV